MAELSDLNDLLGMGSKQQKEDDGFDFDPDRPAAAPPVHAAPPSSSSSSSSTAAPPPSEEGSLRSRNGVPVVDPEELKRRIKGGGPTEEASSRGLLAWLHNVRLWGLPSVQAVCSSNPFSGGLQSLRDGAAANPRVVKGLVLLLFVIAGVIYMQQAKSDATDVEVVLAEPVREASASATVGARSAVSQSFDAAFGEWGAEKPSRSSSAAAVAEQPAGGAVQEGEVGTRADAEDMASLRRAVLDGDQSLREEIKALRGEVMRLGKFLGATPTQEQDRSDQSSVGSSRARGSDDSIGVSKGSVTAFAAGAASSSPSMRGASVGEIHMEARP
mmetsp:Transcript_47922/g.113903  ORF Transcript_47922/g.113903 Transcript_47922/m.113903 type:complete len:329 (-) Transcript_47922:95-1081(-)